MSTAFRDDISGAIGGGVSLGAVAVTIPGTIQAGDIMLAGYVALSPTTDPGGQGTITDPAGWTALAAQAATAQAIAKFWYRIADGGDAGATVTSGYSVDTSKERAALALGAWSGGDRATPIAVQSAVASNTTSGTTHVMPTVNTTGKGPCRIVSIWCGRETTTSSGYTASGGWTVRSQAVEASGAGASVVVIDSGTDQAEGTALGGGTITGNQAAGHNFAITLAIPQSSAVATARPASDVTTTGWTGSTTPGGGTPLCSLVADSDDTTYVVSGTAPTAQTWEAKLPEMTAAPDTVTNRIYFTGGAVSGVVVTKLMQGSTTIATRTDTYTSSPPTSATDLVLTLNGTQQAACTDLTDLRIRCTVTAA